MRREWFVTVLMCVASLAECASEALAQPIGTFRWQLQPYCNVLSLTVTQQGTVYALSGFDDQCGAGQRASVTGSAFFNPDGSVGLGLTTVLAPGGVPVHVDARIAASSLGGPWRDSAGNSGTFTFSPVASAGGPPRPSGPTGWTLAGSFFKRTTFHDVDVPPAGAGSVEFTTTTLVPPASGFLLLRGRGYCNALPASGSTNHAVIGAGTSAVDALGASDHTGIGLILVQQGALSGLSQTNWSAERMVSVVAGASYTVGLFARRDAGGSAYMDCSGSFTVQLLTEVVP